MNTMNNNVLVIITIAIFIALLVLPQVVRSRRKFDIKECLIREAILSFNSTGGKCRRYTPAEDELILSKQISDEEICSIIKRKKNSIQVRRSILIKSK